MALGLVGEDVEAHLVGAVQPFGIQVVHGAGFLERGDGDEAPAPVVGGERGVEFGRPRRSRQRGQMQRDLDDHALAEAPDAGYEERAHGEAAADLDFRHVLVRQAEAVDPKRGRDVPSGVRILEPLDQLPAAAAVAGDGVDGDRRVGRKQPGRDQGMDEHHRGQGITARVADPFRRGDAPGLLGVPFRQAVDPLGIAPVRRAGVDDAQVRVFDHGDGLARRRVGQAEDREIGGVQHLGAGARVLARRLGQAQELDVGAALQPRPDLQARGTDLAVDEDFCRHGVIRFWPSDPSARTIAVK